MIPKFEKDLNIISKLPNLPNTNEGLTAEALKAKFDEIGLELQNYINNILLPAIKAVNIPFYAADLKAEDVQNAIVEVYGQIRGAASGAIVNGSVTQEKLAAELLARTYGGRPWVSVKTPDNTDNVQTDFPIGQIWLRPAFDVENAASDSWNTSGCTAVAEGNALVITGDNTVTVARATQTLANAGEDGDRVYVLFDILDKDSEISNLTVTLNNAEAMQTGAEAYSTRLLAGGTLTVAFNITWPSTSLAGGSVTVANFAIVNVDAILRQLNDAADMGDWASYLRKLLPLSAHHSPSELFVHKTNGEWWPISFDVAPVERGGTGFASISSGEFLYGGDENNIEKLTPGSGFLEMANGVPGWRDVDKFVESLGILKIATGTYTGNGADRTITLPVTPKLIYIYKKNQATSNWWETFERSVVLADGARDREKASVSGSNGYTQSLPMDVSLIENKLIFSGSSNEFASTTGKFANISGSEYAWLAIY